MQIAFPSLVPADSGAQAAASPRLVNAAHEFEAQLMKELMKPLTSGGAPGDPDEDDDSGPGMSLGSGSTAALGDFASEALARALSQQGGFGIANKIIDQLAKRDVVESAHSGTLSAASAGAGKAQAKLPAAPRK